MCLVGELQPVHRRGPASRRCYSRSPGSQRRLRLPVPARTRRRAGWRGPLITATCRPADPTGVLDAGMSQQPFMDHRCLERGQVAADHGWPGRARCRWCRGGGESWLRRSGVPGSMGNTGGGPLQSPDLRLFVHREDPPDAVHAGRRDAWASVIVRGPQGRGHRSARPAVWSETGPPLDHGAPVNAGTLSPCGAGTRRYVPGPGPAS
jgi:hypothetical protein